MLKVIEVLAGAGVCVWANAGVLVSWGGCILLTGAGERLLTSGVVIDAFMAAGASVRVFF